MAVLSSEERRRTWAHLMRQATGPVSITKADLRAAVDAADDWADSNAASYNSALPQPARGALTANQKAMVLAYVCLRRAGLLRTEEDGG